MNLRGFEEDGGELQMKEFNLSESEAVEYMLNAVNMADMVS